MCFNFEMKNESQSPTKNNNNIIIYARGGYYYCISMKNAMQNERVPKDDVRGRLPNLVQLIRCAEIDSQTRYPVIIISAINHRRVLKALLICSTSTRKRTHFIVIRNNVICNIMYILYASAAHNTFNETFKHVTHNMILHNRLRWKKSVKRWWCSGRGWNCR